MGAIGSVAFSTKNSFYENPEFLFLIPIAMFAAYILLKYVKKFLDRFKEPEKAEPVDNKEIYDKL
jgi:hypothetical protein